MLVLAILPSLFLQDPTPPPAQQDPKPVQPPAVVEWSDREARDAVSAFKKAMKGKKVSMGDRMKAVEALAKGSNKRLIQPLAAVVVNDKTVTVRTRAAEVLGDQPQKEANRTIVKLIGNDKVKDTPAVLAALIRSLSKAGYNRQWKTIDDLFEREYSVERVVVQQAILELVIAHKEKLAVDLLLRNMDEPIPDDVDSPSNPPASYWEGRWKAWRVWRGDVKEAMFALTGQRFTNSKEARTWIRKNGAKVGLK